MCPHLFVYGTLQSSFDHPVARSLAARAELLGPARLRGRIYRVTPRYPGLVLSEDPRDRVHGEVYFLRDPPALLETLDRYEGCSLHSPKPFEYERVLASARLEGGRSIEVWTYVYRRPVRGEDLIASGFYGPHSSV